jgi:ABC-type uncharacterized transport system substrate-binding protein
MKKLRLIFVFSFLLGLAVLIIGFNTTKPRLLVLQSYDKDYAWSREVDVGIRRVLGSRSEYAVRWFYMDTKRHPWKDFKVNAGRSVQKLINSWQPAVVIAIDDDAQQFAMKAFNNRPDVKVVFAGVNSAASAYGYDKASNVTGILERLPLDAVRETMLIASKSRNLTSPARILFLGDRSETVVADEAYFRGFDWAPLQVQASQLVETFDQWKASVQLAQQQADFIVVSNYRKILRTAGGSDLVPPQELIDWTEQNSRVPILGTNVFFAQDGGMLAIGTSPYEQGEVAMRMARDLLDHPDKPTGAIAIETTRQYVVAMRASRMQARQFKLPSVYESAARSSNNFYP